MSDGNAQVDAPVNVEVAADAVPVGSTLSISDAIQQVLKKALVHNKLVRGLRECAKALDRRHAVLAVLAESCDEPNYVRLVESLCAHHNIPLVKVSDGETLGQWAGLCKIDKDGNPRKVVKASCVVVKEWGEESEGRNVLLESFKSA
ncbi:putative 40S ribosomal protein S12 [Ramicandelaber brevisporus]|nr:putative 40S ribosomal protein S12 [Ramicandelaber brevisporus]